jgi:hypothetical protein
MGYSLAFYAQIRKLDIEALKLELGCDEEKFSKLIVCRNIIFGDSNFQNAVQQVAHYTGANEVALANLLKRVAFLKSIALEVSKNSKDLGDSKNYLAAAREKEDKTDSSKPSENS